MNNIYISIAPNLSGSYELTAHSIAQLLRPFDPHFVLSPNSYEADIIIQIGVDNDIITCPNKTGFHWFFCLESQYFRTEQLVEKKGLEKERFQIVAFKDKNNLVHHFQTRGNELVNKLRVVLTELSAHMLADDSIKSSERDYLGYEDFADALYGIIDHGKTATPLTLAIDAPWGAGKTSLGHLIKNKLSSKPSSIGKYPHTVCWFNAWMHDDAANLSTSFTSHIAYTAHKNRSWWRRVFTPIPVELVPVSEQKKERLFWFFKFSIASFLISTAIFTAINHNWISKSLILDWLEEMKIPTPYGLKTFLGTTSVFGFSYAIQFVFKYLLTTARSINSYVKHPELEAKGGNLEKVRYDLKTLIKHATPRGSKFVVFVDDLERCRGNGPIDLLEKINQLFNIPNTVVVLMTDLKIISKLAEERYAKQAIKDKCSFGRKYIQKIIQINFDLPQTHNISKIEKMVSEKISTRQSEPESDSKWYNKLYTFKEENYYPLHNILNTKNPITLAYRLYTLPLFFIHYIVDNTLYRHWKSSELNAQFFSRALVELSNVFYLISIPGLILLEKKYNLGFHDGWHLFLGVISLNFITFSFNKLISVQGFSIAIRRYRKKKQTITSTVWNEVAKTKMIGWPKIPTSMKSLMRKEKGFGQLEKDSIYFIDARKAAFEMLQILMLLNPRNVKRITNRIRLILYVSKSRGTLEFLNIELVAKWSIMQECWPELALKLSEPNGYELILGLENNIHNHSGPNSPFAQLITNSIENYENEINNIKKILEYKSNDQDLKLSKQLRLLTRFE